MHKIRAILAFLFFIFYPYILLSNEISKNNIESIFSEPLSTKIVDTIINYIDNAKVNSKLYMTMYLLNDKRVIESLKRAKNRDIDINILIDRDKRNNYIKKLNQSLCSSKKNTCIKSCKGSCLGKKEYSNKGIIHDKFILISKLSDGRANIILQTSSNLYEKSTTRFQDLVVISENKQLYDKYLTHYKIMKSENPTLYNADLNISLKDIDVFFSPNTTNKQDIILNILNKVTCDKNSSIKMAMAYFQDRRADLAKKLNKLSAQGCKVEIITGIHWQKNHYKAPGYKIIELLKNKIIKYEGNLHSKIILIDALIDNNKTKLVLTGSHNLTYYAMYVNDETLLAIKDDKIYDDYLKFWNNY